MVLALRQSVSCPNKDSFVQCMGSSKVNLRLVGNKERTAIVPKHTLNTLSSNK